jgi:hypothetical protein
MGLERVVAQKDEPGPGLGPAPQDSPRTTGLGGTNPSASASEHPPRRDAAFETACRPMDRDRAGRTAEVEFPTASAAGRVARSPPWLFSAVGCWPPGCWRDVPRGADSDLGGRHRQKAKAAGNSYSPLPVATAPSPSLTDKVTKPEVVASLVSSLPGHGRRSFRRRLARSSFPETEWPAESTGASFLR